MPPLVANYQLDPTIETKKENLSFEQGYNFEYHNFLFNIKDTSINKSSTFFLTDTTNVVDNFDIKDIPFEYPVNLTTFLAYNTIDIDPISGLSAVTGTCVTSVSTTTAISAVSANNDLNATYLTISDDITLESDGINTKQVGSELFITRRTEPSLPQKYYFNIMLINAVDCYIYHLEGEDRWYLSQKDQPGEILKFTRVTHQQGFENLLDQIQLDGGDKIKFQYNMLPNGRIRLYKQYDGKTHIVKMLTPEERDISPELPPVRLEPTLDPDNDSLTETAEPNINELTEYTTIRIRPPFKQKSYKELSPVVTNYDTSLSNNSLSASNYTDSIKTNMLVHSEYYYLTGEFIPVNFFNLKNDQTPYGITKSNNIDPRNDSIYFNREYNKIDTGTNQLDGSSNISLEYSTNTHTFTFKPGMNYFNTPQDVEPFTKININDTNIFQSGAIAGGNPAQSDKIYKQRKSSDIYSLTTKWGISVEEQLGTWLCTWLSGGDNPNIKPVWVDRYYNPSKTGFVEALTEVTDFVHNKYTTTSLEVFESNEGEVIDIPSILTIEPGKHYAYYRINKNDIVNNLSTLDPHHIQAGISNYKTTSNTPGVVRDSTYNFDGKHIGELPNGQKLNNVSQFSLSLDINLENFKKTQNHQIIGNYTSSGLGLFQRNDTSPFMFLLGSDGAAVNNQVQNSSIRIYDNNFKLYNYITNDSYLQDSESPGLFHSLVIRELPEEIFAISTTGDIVEITHDGIVLAKYTQWSTDFAIPYHEQTGVMPKLIDITWDERYIYILSHVGTGKRDYKIHEYDMVSKKFKETNDRCKIFNVPIPGELTSTQTTKRGRYIDSNTPPTHISILDGSGDYASVRTIYLTTGDISKTGSRYIWTYVQGSSNTLTNIQENHDLLYCFDTHELKLLPGLLTDNNLVDDTIPLSIIDYVIDSEQKIWLIHNENILSVFDTNRKLIKTQVLEEQQGVSLVVTRDFTETGVIEDRVVILGNTTGEETLELQIGPVNHPTNDPSSNDWRKASPWIINGKTYDRRRFTDTTSEIYDDLSSYDESTQILYPFVDGNARFGEQLLELQDMPSDDPGGRVLDGDYELITEGFDFFVNESPNILKGSIFNSKTCNLLEVKTITDFTIDDLQNLPQLINHYEYSVLNFNRYSKNNLNFKLNLEPLFKKDSPDKINLKINLDDINHHPYTGFFNITINFNNILGRVEMWLNGQLKDEHIYEFDQHKYTFTNILTKKIIVGATPFLNDTLLYNKLNSKFSYLVKDVKIKNINMYNRCLKYHDILNILRQQEPVTEMIWEVPTKRKNYIETIERMFNHSIPPRKSNTFDVVIRNSSIRSLNLQSYISNKVLQVLKKITPAGTRVRDITWSNEILDFTSLSADDIDYNPVADEIIVDPSGITLPAYLPYVLQ